VKDSDELIPFQVVMTGVETMALQKEMLKYIYAFSIGDGNLRLRGSNATYRNAQLEIHRDYVQYQVTILEELTSVNVRYEIRELPRKPRFAFETKQHPLYTQVYNRMYSNGHKVIDPHGLTFMDFESLAILHMDDGHLAKRYNTVYNRLDYNVILATESFSYGDNYILSKAIKEKTNLAFDIVNQTVNGKIKHRLRLSKKQTPYFIEGVSKYIVPSFQYKVDLPND